MHPTEPSGASDSPFVTIRDQVAAQVAFSDAIGIQKWAAVIGGSMGGMQALEWAISNPERVERVGILATPEQSNADQIALNTVQVDAIHLDPEILRRQLLRCRGW